MTITSEKDMQESFKLFLEPGKKGLTKKSIYEAFGDAEIEVGEEDLRQLVEELDENGDGKVTYEEFKRLMTKWRMNDLEKPLFSWLNDCVHL